MKNLPFYVVKICIEPSSCVYNALCSSPLFFMGPDQLIYIRLQGGCYSVHDTACYRSGILVQIALSKFLGQPYKLVHQRHEVATTLLEHLSLVPRHYLSTVTLTKASSKDQSLVALSPGYSMHI